MPKEINSDLLRGNINTIILSALYSGDRYGYDIVSEIEQKSHGQFSIKQPTLYSCLKRLESLGYVSSYWGEQSNGGRRKYFSLTDLGREVFKQSQDDYEYSRTVIDKLISENKYDLGDEPAISRPDERISSEQTDATSTSVVTVSTVAEQEKTNIETVNDVITSEPEYKNILAEKSEQTSEQNAANETAKDDGAQLSISDIAVQPEKQPDLSAATVDEDKTNNDVNDGNVSTGDGGRFLPPDFGRQPAGEQNKEFAPYNTSETHFDGAESAKKGDISWFDAGIAAQNEQKQPEVGEETEDISAIFNRTNGENSYIDDLKTGDLSKSNNIFSPTAKNVEYDSIASAMPFGDNYSEADYPYADSSDSAADAIEAELSPLKEEKTDFIRYHDGEEMQKAGDAAQAEIESSATPGNEYQNVLTEMIDKFGNTGSDITKTDIENNALELNDRVSVRAFGNIVESARELGEEVVVRTNDNSAKHRYSVKYYYNDSLLRLVIGGMLFVIMLLESLVTYIVCKNGVGSTGKLDTATFVLAIIVSLVIPIVAAIKYYNNPRAKKRIENSIIESLWYKLVVMLLICLLSFGVNLFMGMPLRSSIADYSVTLFMPMILSTNLPLSYLFFRLLYRNKFFAAKE